MVFTAAASRSWGVTLSALLCFTPFGAAFGKVLDCPLRDQAYSIDSPLMDIALSPRAWRELQQAAPALAGRIPPPFQKAEAPSFAAILTLRTITDLFGDDKHELPAADAALRMIVPDAVDKQARCSRYDDHRPVLAQAPGGHRILLFEKINGFRDAPSVDAAHDAFVNIARRKGWTLVSTDQSGVMTADQLAKFDVVIWNNVSGDVLTMSQRAAFRHYIERGGGFVGVHGSGGDPVYFWDWYADQLIGARFIGHPANPQFQDARIVTGSDNAITAGLPSEWHLSEEWYSFASDLRKTGAHILLALDEATYWPIAMGNNDIRMGDHPIAWTRCVGNGRVFYNALGHRSEIYADTNNVRLLEQGIAWAMGRGKTACRSGQETPRR